MILVKSIMECLGEGYIVTDRLGIQKLIQFKDVFDLSYEMDRTDGKNYIVLNTKFGKYQALMDGE